MSKTQGGKANESGSRGEKQVGKDLNSLGLRSIELKYYPTDATAGVGQKKTDHYVPTRAAVVEVKNQDVGGTADQKLENEIWNAVHNFTIDNFRKQGLTPVKHYVIVVTGAHWSKPTSRHKLHRAKQLVQFLKDNDYTGDLETLEVVTREEFPALIETIRPAKRYDIREVSREQATELVQANHYSPVMPKLTKHWLGLYRENKFVGVVTLGWGTRPLHTIQKIVDKELDSSSYYEIGKMCLLDSEPKNSETQMLSQLVTWIKDVENKRRRDRGESEVQFLYTLADGIMGKCGYVYQAANFYYGGEYWTDSYMSAKGEKVHPRTTRELCKENWKFHYEQSQTGFSQEFRDNHDSKVSAATASGSKLPKEQVFWLTPEFMNHVGMKKIKGKMFRYIYPLNKKAKKMLKKSPEIDWKIGSGIYPKDKDLKWKQMVARKKYEDLDGIPNWDLSVVEYNKKNVNAHKKG